MPFFFTSSSHSHSNNFDLLRLLAATQVLLLHYSYHAGDRSFATHTLWEQLLFPFPGVPIFFFISGYLITLSWQRKSDMLHYARQRIRRIYPALWAHVPISVGLVFISGYGAAAWLGQGWFWAFLTSLFSGFALFHPDSLRGYGTGVLNGSLWTIPIELTFYAAVPVFFMLFSSVQWRARLLLLLLCASYVVYETSWIYRENTLWRVVSITLAAHGWEFILGMLACLYRERLQPLLAGKALWLFLLYLGCYALFGNLYYIETGQSRPFGVFLLLTIVRDLWVFAFAFSAPRWGAWLRGQDISYGLYLYHIPVLNFLLALGYSGWVAGTLGAVLTLALAVASWRWIEKPFLRRHS